MSIKTFFFEALNTIQASLDNLDVFVSRKQSPLIICRFAAPNKFAFVSEARMSECTFFSDHVSDINMVKTQCMLMIGPLLSLLTGTGRDSL